MNYNFVKKYCILTIQYFTLICNMYVATRSGLSATSNIFYDPCLALALIPPKYYMYATNSTTCFHVNPPTYVCIRTDTNRCKFITLYHSAIYNIGIILDWRSLSAKVSHGIAAVHSNWVNY